MDSSLGIVPNRSSPDPDVSGNHDSLNASAPATVTEDITETLVEEAPASRRNRPSRACTLRAKQRLQEQQEAERKLRPAKKEQRRRNQQRQRQEADEEKEEGEEEEEEDGEQGSARDQQQCGGGSTSKIVTSLVPPPEPSQIPRWNIRSMWELASVLNFLHVFRPLLKINVEFSAEEFETALLTPNDTLSDIHIPLLKAIPPVTRMALTRETWVTVLCRKLRDWWHWVAEGELPIVTSHGMEVDVYKSLDPGIRVVILKALCDIRVEQDDIRGYIDNSLKSGVHLSAFRKDRVGGDSHGVNFWYEGDPIIGHRLYREIRKAEPVKVKTKGSKVIPNVTYQWEAVATNFDEFQDVSEKLLSSSNRTEASLGKKLKNDMLPVIEKEHKRKEKLLKKQHRQALLLDNFLVVDGLGAGRSLRDRKPVRYTFDDYDRSINEALKITKKRSPSPEPPIRRRESTRLDAPANNGRAGSTLPSDLGNDTSERSSSSAEYNDMDEHKSESLDRSNRRRQRSQWYSTMDFVETVSDNEADFGSDDDIVGEAIYDEEYLRTRKKRKNHSSGSEGDEEYRWDEDNVDDEDEDSVSVSEEDSDEPQRVKKMPRRETKLRPRRNDRQPALRRSKRATRNRVNYNQYELSESDTEAARPARSQQLIEQDDRSYETENDGFSMGSQESKDNKNDPETKDAEKPIQDNDNGDKTEKESDGLLDEMSKTDQGEVEGVGERRYLDLNELAPVSGFDDGLNTVVKNNDKDNS